MRFSHAEYKTSQVLPAATASATRGVASRRDAVPCFRRFEVVRYFVLSRSAARAARRLEMTKVRSETSTLSIRPAGERTPASCRPLGPFALRKNIARRQGECDQKRERR